MEDSKVFVIPDDLCRRAGVTASWLGPNLLSARAYQHVNSSTKDTPTQFAPCQAKIHHIRPEIILESPILRKLVNESNGTFLAVQQLSGDNVQQQLVLLSRQYRSIIRACLENLQQHVNNTSGKEKENYQNFMTIFYSIECVWHLCEILLVDPAPGNIVVPQLLEWIRFHFPSHEQTAAQILVGGTGAESKSNYWPCVKGLIGQGRVDVVRALLRLHSASGSAPFKLADNLLRAMPIYNIYGGTSLNEFSSRWRHWSLDCTSQIESNTFASDINLKTIMELVVGDAKAWQEERQYSDAWYELFPGWLLYTEPGSKWFNLADLARNWLVSSGRPESLRHLDKVLLAVMECDMHQVIREIQHMSENGWFAAHLTDLLYHCGRLSIIDQNQVNVTPVLRESLLLDYGTLLFGCTGMWQAGLSYLDHCSEHGRAASEILLPRVPLNSERIAMSVIREAAKRELHSTVSSICKIRGMLFLRRGRLGNALTWALKSQDRDFSTYLADKFLQDYCQEGSITSKDLLDSLGPCMMISDRLIFLAKYQEFHRLYHAQEFKEAGKLLISLLDITPKYFWYTLLKDALPLLEADYTVFDSEDTYTLLQSLTTFCNMLERNYSEMEVNKQNADTSIAKIISGVDNDGIKLIRLAAARNLSRALIKEGCDTVS